MHTKESIDSFSLRHHHKIFAFDLCRLTKGDESLMTKINQVHYLR